MKTLHMDVAIIGAGTAGMSAYRATRVHTDKVLLIESGPYGTTCARVGCMPSKLLIAAADAAHAIAQAGHFGVHGGELYVDGAAVMARVRSERDRFVGFVVDDVEAWPVEHRLRGNARFVDDNTLEVDGHTRVTAARIVIATGSRPAVPQAWRDALGDRLIVSDDVFDWTTLPRSVAVVGAGVIGLELAQALHRLRVRVRLYGRSERVGPLTDPALQALAQDIFQRELPLTSSVESLALEREGESVLVRSITSDGDVQEERFDWLLAATGRQPNVEALNLAATSMTLGDQACLCLIVRPARWVQPRCSSPAMCLTIGRCCTKPPMKDASPATTRVVSMRYGPTRAGRLWRWCSANHKSCWPARATPNSHEAARRSRRAAPRSKTRVAAA